MGIENFYRVGTAVLYKSRWNCKHDVTIWPTYRVTRLAVHKQTLCLQWKGTLGRAQWYTVRSFVLTVTWFAHSYVILVHHSTWSIDPSRAFTRLYSWLTHKTYRSAISNWIWIITKTHLSYCYILRTCMAPTLASIIAGFNDRACRVCWLLCFFFFKWRSYWLFGSSSNFSTKMNRAKWTQEFQQARWSTNIWVNTTYKVPIEAVQNSRRRNSFLVTTSRHWQPHSPCLGNVSVFEFDRNSDFKMIIYSFHTRILPVYSIYSC